MILRLIIVIYNEYKSMKTKDALRLHLSYTNINIRDSRRIGIIKIINLYRIRVRKIAP